MVKIPRLAQSGIINDNTPLMCVGENDQNLFKDKYYQIYKRTKNRRIKKKQEEKSWILKHKKIINNLCEFKEIQVNIKMEDLLK